MKAAPATLRRDLGRLTEAGLISRVRGGARRAEGPGSAAARAAINAADNPARRPRRRAVPGEHPSQPAAETAIGRAAARLCNAGEAVMIDGGSTTLQMREHPGRAQHAGAHELAAHRECAYRASWHARAGAGGAGVPRAEHHPFSSGRRRFAAVSRSQAVHGRGLAGGGGPHAGGRHSS